MASNPKMIMWWVTVVPTRWVSLSTWSSTQISATFYYNMWTGWVPCQIINDAGSQTWTSGAVQVDHIQRVATAKLKWGNKQRVKPRAVVWIWNIWHGTFFGMHPDGTYMSTITWTANDGYVSAWTITPRNYVWYLTVNVWDNTYVVPYYTPTQ